MTKKVERQQARKLRSSGMAITKIAKRLGVSKGSVSVWVRDIELTKEMQAVLKLRPGNYLGGIGAAILSARAREKRRQYQQEGRDMARLIITPLFIGGCMLYWAEGSKDKNACILVNSNPNMLKFFKQFLVKYFGVKDDQFAVSVTTYLNNGLSLEEIEDWWLQMLGLSRKHLRKSIVKTGTTNRKRRLVYGICRLKVCSTEVVQKIFGAIQEIGGFDHPEWLH